MASSTIKFDGAEGLLEKFKAMTSEARANTLSAAVEPAADFVREAIFARAPVLSGKLASDISIVALTETADRFVMAVKIEDEAFYWRFLEFGTVKMAAQPFIRPSFVSSRAQARNEIRDGIRDSVEGFTE